MSATCTSTKTLFVFKSLKELHRTKLSTELLFDDLDPIHFGLVTLSNPSAHI